MPAKYTRAEKINALRWLDRLDGNINATSQRTGIPPRTLRDWRTDRRLGRIKIERTPEETYADPASEVDSREIRRRILHQIDILTQQTDDNPRNVYYQSLALRRLLEEIERFNRVLPPSPS